MKKIRLIKNILKNLESLVSFIICFLSPKEKYMLMSNGMSLGGAPLMLYQAAKIYRQKGKEVYVFTETYGDLIKELRSESIKVFYSSEISKKLINMLFKYHKIQFCLVNTVVESYWIKSLSECKIPSLWWIHEGVFYIEKYKSLLPKELKSNIRVATVGNRPKEALKNNGLDYMCDDLLYGINDRYSKIINQKNIDQFVFLVIGTIYHLKNQMDIIEAYDILPQKYKEKVFIHFIGEPIKESDLYYKEFLKKLSNNDHLLYLGKMSHEKLMREYEQVDGIICSSLDDTMPVVITEALMYGKVVITSSETGQYILIRNGIDGYTYNVQNITSLSEKIQEVLSHRNVEEIEKNARRLYLKYFSMETFEKQLMKLTTECLEAQNEK